MNKAISRRRGRRQRRESMFNIVEFDGIKFWLDYVTGCNVYLAVIPRPWYQVTLYMDS